MPDQSAAPATAAPTCWVVTSVVTAAGREAVHRDPVWRDRANFIIAISTDPGDTDVKTEQLWSRRVSERLFELCCIPFFAYDLALKDVVEVDDAYMVQRVHTPSGRFVFRAYFEEKNYVFRGPVTTALHALGCELEWSSAGLLAVDARDEAHAQEVADYLHEQESESRLEYETGKSA